MKLNRKIFKPNSLRYMRIIALPLILMIFTGNPASAQVIEIPAQLKKLIAEAQTNNLDLQMWEAKLDALELRIPQAGAWSDPMAGLGIANLPVNSFDFNQEPMTAFWITASQDIPITKKPDIKEQIARYSFEGDSLKKLDKKLNISGMTVSTWFEWAYLEDAIDFYNESISILDNVLALANKKLETGKGSLADVLRIETEKSGFESRVISLSQSAKAKGRNLTLLLARESENIPEQPDGLTLSFTVLDRNNLIAKLKNDNPQLALQRKESETAKARVDLAQRLWYGDLKLTAAYGIRQDADNGMSRPDFFTLTAGIPVPIFGSKKQSKAIAEARAQLRSAEFNLQSEELKQTTRLNILLDDDESLAEQIELYRTDFIPQAETTFSAVKSSYSVGKAEMEMLLSAEKMILKTKLEYLSLILNRLKTRTSIAVITGGDDL